MNDEGIGTRLCTHLKTTCLGDLVLDEAKLWGGIDAAVEHACPATLGFHGGGVRVHYGPIIPAGHGALIVIDSAGRR